jgi:hypothetical protein
MPVYTFVKSVALFYLGIPSAIVNAWKYKYEGDAHKLLSSVLLKMSDGIKYHTEKSCHFAKAPEWASLGQLTN